MTSEVFALTDEQILGMEGEGQDAELDQLTSEQVNASRGPSTAAATAAASARDDRVEHNASTVAQEPPAWLAREMKDPWAGDEARELWEGVQRAQREAAAYREAFATPEDARALKEIYPGGAAEAKGAAERARELAEIDAVFFGAAGKTAEELRAGRTALVEKLHAQDPAAFREMVEAGVKILGGVAGGQRPVAREEGRTGQQDATSLPGSFYSESQTALLSGPFGVAQGRRDDSLGDNANGNLQHLQSYREFERATNAELEKNVGGAIGRAMEAALPNLRSANGSGGNGQPAPLQERLRAAVREEVEIALRSDASLGEQVARVLSGRRLDESARAQVVRLIDARAQQLVPGAVRKVVGTWTQATLGARKTEAGVEERRPERASNSSRTPVSGDSAANRDAQATAARSVSRGRVDYRKFSDEQILGM